MKKLPTPFLDEKPKQFLCHRFATSYGLGLQRQSDVTNVALLSAATGDELAVVDHHGVAPALLAADADGYVVVERTDSEGLQLGGTRIRSDSSGAHASTARRRRAIAMRSGGQVFQQPLSASLLATTRRLGAHPL